MTSSSEPQTQALAGALQVLRRRFADLAARDGALAPGYRTVCSGLQQLLDAAVTQAEAIPAADKGAANESNEALRLELLSVGLAAMADLLDPPDAGDAAAHEAGAPLDASAAGTQFQQMFRREAREQMRALAIAMMGILNDQGASDGVSRSARCLHAVRGAAAMVGLGELAQVAGAMEAVVKHIDAQSSDARTRPARALLGGFRLLEAALAQDDFALDPARLAQTTRALNAYHPGAAQPHSGATQPAAQPIARPVTEPAARTTHPRPNGAAGPGASSKRILVVDDIDTVAASVGFVLAELAVAIDVARHGAHALEMLRQRPYSLVITDVDMPHMDGTTLTRMIRNDPALKDIPVILLTSLDRPDERDAGIEAGASDYVIKGAIGGGELLGRVRALLQVAPDVPAHAHPPQPAPLRVLIAEDVDTIAAGIAFVLSEGPFTLEIARDGARALSCLRNQHYDILLSDVEMPEMSGLELLEAVRADDALVDLPVILLTSVHDPEVEQRALNLGADRFLLKGDVSGGQLRQILEAAAAARIERARMQHIALDTDHFPDPTSTQCPP